MAKLTPLAKGLIAVTILSITAAAAWQLGVKDMVSGDDSSGEGPVFGDKTNDKEGPLGSPGNPLKVSIVSFHGYAPALVANGQKGIFFHGTKNGRRTCIKVQPHRNRSSTTRHRKSFPYLPYSWAVLRWHARGRRIARPH